MKDGDHPETVAARILPTLGFYSPNRVAAAITCPTLVQVMPDDAHRHLGRPENDIKDPPRQRHHGGHFESYVEPMFPIAIEE